MVEHGAAGQGDASEHKRGYPAEWSAAWCERAYGVLRVAVVAWDAGMRVCYANAAATKILGASLEELRGQSVAMTLRCLPVRDGKVDASAPPLDADVLNCQMLLARPDGGRRWVESRTALAGMPATGEATQITILLDHTEATGREETLKAELDLLAARLANQELHDVLTGLPTRLLFFDRVEHALRAAQREDTSFALCLFEIDEVDRLNTALGRARADVVVQEAAARIAGTLRNVDTVARIDAGVFAVLLPGATEVGATNTARRIGDVLRMPLAIGDEVVQLDVCAGTALNPIHASDASALFSYAEVALRAAKEAGTGFMVYDAGLGESG